MSFSFDLEKNSLWITGTCRELEQYHKAKEKKNASGERPLLKIEQVAGKNMYQLKYVSGMSLWDKIRSLFGGAQEYKLANVVLLLQQMNFINQIPEYQKMKVREAFTDLNEAIAKYNKTKAPQLIQFQTIATTSQVYSKTAVPTPKTPTLKQSAKKPPQPAPQEPIGAQKTPTFTEEGIAANVPPETEEIPASQEPVEAQKTPTLSEEDIAASVLFELREIIEILKMRKLPDDLLKDLEKRLTTIQGEITEFTFKQSAIQNQVMNELELAFFYLNLHQGTYGRGIENKGSNLCYANSIAQALFQTPVVKGFFQNPISDKKPTTAVEKLKRDLHKIFQISRGTKATPAHTVSDSRMNRFRHQAFATKEWPERNTREREGSQQDAALFLQFVLDNLAIEEIKPFRQKIVHDQSSLIIPALDLAKLDPMSILSLALGTKSKTVDDLVNTNEIPEIDQKNNEVDVTEHVALEKESCPKALPIQLKRYQYNPGDESWNKNTQEIAPSLDVNVSILHNDKEKAHYELSAVVVHSGAKSLDGGHYYTFVPKKIQGELYWIRYNDDEVSLCKGTDLDDLDNTVDETIEQNGYVYLYNFKGLVPKEQPT